MRGTSAQSTTVLRKDLADPLATQLSDKQFYFQEADRTLRLLAGTVQPPAANAAVRGGGGTTHVYASMKRRGDDTGVAPSKRPRLTAPLLGNASVSGPGPGGGLNFTLSSYVPPVANRSGLAPTSAQLGTGKHHGPSETAFCTSFSEEISLIKLRF